MIIYRQETEEYKHKLTLLAKEALETIEKMPPPVIQFCGPISTGGFGSVSDNIDCLVSLINEGSKRRLSVFNQISFERRLDKVLENHFEYDYPLLDYFYKPILSSGKINGLIFLPLWQTSIGSTWEHDFAMSLGIPIFHMENMFFEEVESFYKKLKN